MTLADFKIGMEFRMSGNRWRCTDIGTRIISAIKLDRDDDPTWYNGPPYIVAEMCIDENDMEACEPIGG